MEQIRLTAATLLSLILASEKLQAIQKGFFKLASPGPVPFLLLCVSRLKSSFLRLCPL